jgi:hypothetical protein
MRARFVAFRVSICLLAASLAACGGGGGGGGSSLPPIASPGGPGNVPSSGPASVAFSIAIPAAPASGSSSLRRARYVSAGTKSVSVSYGGTAQTANCSTTCSLVLSVSPGTVTFTVSLFDAQNGGGHLLSSGQATATVAAGQSNAVNVTFGAVVASVAVALGTGSVPAGTPATIPVTVTAKDAAGYTIVGSDPYNAPIVLSNDDASGATRLSVTTLAAPGAPVSLAYNGSASIAAVHVTASVPSAGISSQVATLNVQGPQPPSGRDNPPAHIQTWYYYGLDDVNASIPASFMVAHADYVEDDGFTAQHAQAFKNAGGKYAAAYTDPSFVPYCNAPFSAPAGRCDGPIGNLVSGDESAWVHGADGARVHRYMDSHFLYQDALDPASASAQNAYRQVTATVAAAAPKLDYIFADDSGGPLTGGDGTPASGWLFGFNALATEITSDASYLSAEQRMIAASVKPVFLNGATPYTKAPSYGGAFLTAPNVAGQNYETCYGEGAGLLRDDSNGGPRWTLQSNALLAVFAHGRPAVCMDESPATPANRVYFLASWWLTYNEAYSIAAPQGTMSDGFTVRAEFDIVPRQPRTTASADIAALRAGGAYVREFAACYQAGAAIGPCAAVVNPGTGTVALPALAGRYTSSLVLDDKSAYTGGKAAWSGQVPAQLAPVSAVVLR